MGGDPEARQRLIEEHGRLVWDIVNRFRGRGEDTADLFQVGCIGLLKAADRFDPAFGTQFSTFAVPTVMGEIRRHLRDHGPLRVSRRLKEVAGRAAQVRTGLTARLGREPTLEELAVATGVTADELVDAMEASIPPISLYEPLSDDDSAGLVLDRIPGRESDAEVLDHIALGQALRRLPPRQRLILELRFFAELTQATVAARLGISQAQVSRLEKQALALMRGQLEA